MTLFATIIEAQTPAIWKYSTNRIKEDVYEIHITATIQDGWHIFSQTQPKAAIATQTTIKFSKNPLVSFDGKIKEVGKLEKYKDKTLDIEQYQYSNTVDFVQTIKLKGKAKTNITGTITYQTCNDHECLPPVTNKFSVVLE